MNTQRTLLSHVQRTSYVLMAILLFVVLPSFPLTFFGSFGFVSIVLFSFDSCVDPGLFYIPACLLKVLFVDYGV